MTPFLDVIGTKVLRASFLVIGTLGQKSEEFSSLLFTVTSTNEFYSPFPPHPPPADQKWFETGSECKQCTREPQV
jgi:hypothetical protein